MRKYLSILMALALAGFFAGAFAQEPDGDEDEKYWQELLQTSLKKRQGGDSLQRSNADIARRLTEYTRELSSLTMELEVSDNSRLQILSTGCRRTDAVCQLYIQAHQEAISADEDLMNLVGDYKQTLQSVNDAIQQQIQKNNNLDDFDKAENYIRTLDSTYSDYMRKAKKYALIKKTADRLDAVKQEENITRAEMDAKYAKAQAVAEENVALAPRFEKLKEHYGRLATESGKIQQMEYQSLFDRIKNYLFGLAAVSMILMFVNMASTKLKAAKQLKDSAKKVKEMMKQNENEYPEI